MKTIKFLLLVICLGSGQVQPMDYEDPDQYGDYYDYNYEEYDDDKDYVEEAYPDYDEPSYDHSGIGEDDEDYYTMEEGSGHVGQFKNSLMALLPCLIVITKGQ